MNIFGGITSLISDVIDKIFPDKDEAQKAKLKLMELEQKGDLNDLKTRMSAILAEAKSNDPWTSRARPSFMYVMYILLLFAIPMGVLSVVNPSAATTITHGMTAYLNALPDNLWWLFGAGYLGYTGAQSYDKKKIGELFKKN